MVTLTAAGIRRKKKAFFKNDPDDLMNLLRYDYYYLYIYEYDYEHIIIRATVKVSRHHHTTPSHPSHPSHPNARLHLPEEPHTQRHPDSARKGQNPICLAAAAALVTPCQHP